AVAGDHGPVVQMLPKDRPDQGLHLVSRRSGEHGGAHRSVLTPSREGSTIAPLPRLSPTGATWIPTPAASSIPRHSSVRPESETTRSISSNPHNRARASLPNLVWSATIITSCPQDIICRSVSTRSELEL